MERKPCKRRDADLSTSFWYGLNDEFNDWAHFDAEGLSTGSTVVELIDGNDGDDRVDEADPAAANSTSDKLGWILESFEDKF